MRFGIGEIEDYGPVLRRGGGDGGYGVEVGKKTWGGSLQFFPGFESDGDGDRGWAEGIDISGYQAAVFYC